MVPRQPGLRCLCRPVGAEHSYSLGRRATRFACPLLLHTQTEDLIMFNYLFPIFCFGLAICGIVFLGILEASKQLKVEVVEEELPARLHRETTPLRPLNR